MHWKLGSFLTNKLAQHPLGQKIPSLIPLQASVHEWLREGKTPALSLGSDHSSERAHGRIHFQGSCEAAPIPCSAKSCRKSWAEIARCHSVEGTKPLATFGFPVARDTETNSLTSVYEIIYFTFLVLKIIWNSLSKTDIKGTKRQRFCSTVNT